MPPLKHEDQRYMRRILMLGAGWFPPYGGGLERYFRNLLEALPEARGVVVGPVEGSQPRVRAASRITAPIPIRVAAFFRAAATEARRADLIDAHFALYGWLPLHLGPARNKPLIIHFQGPWADENVFAGDRSRLRRAARRRLEKSVYRRATVIVTLTGAFRRVLVERYNVSPWRIEVLAPGVDARRFTSGDGDRHLHGEAGVAQGFTVCCVRRLVHRMGLEVLLDAWPAVLEMHPNSRLLIAGEGPLQHELRRRVQNRGLEGSVQLLGRISEEELIALYQTSDLSVVPSVAAEGFGLVILEAAACGTPSIVTDTGGLPEAISGLAGDLVVPAGDSSALASRLIDAARGELPSRSETRAWAEQHDWAAVADAHRELVRQIFSRRGSDKLRVVYLDHVAELSGGELALFRLLNHLDGVAAHVVLATDGPLADRMSTAGVSVEVLPLRARTRELRRRHLGGLSLPLSAVLDTLLYTLRLALRLRRIRPDLVHTNSLKAGLYGSLAARLAKVPVIWHLHDRLDRDYLPRPAVLLLRLATRVLPQLVICNSEATRRTISRRTGVLVIPPVTPLDPQRSAGSRPGEPLHIGIVGRLTPWKGQDVFLRAFAEAFPQCSVRAVIVGAALFGESELAFAKQLHDLARDLGIYDRVDFRGHREDVFAELHRLDVLVHCSTLPEPFGQVIVEGMSARLPVVASCSGGPEEVITDGVDGLLYRPGDVHALAAILRHLANDPRQREQLGHRARQRAEEFSPSGIAQRVVTGYTQLHAQFASPARDLS